MEILVALGYHLYVDHPHKYILNYTSAILETPTEFNQLTWNIANDCLKFVLIYYLKLSLRTQRTPKSWNRF